VTATASEHPEHPAAQPGDAPPVAPPAVATPEQAATSDSATAPAAAEEGLPEWEPLTPELVEDEAIRGDFVIKWAVVLLAVLLASMRIAETQTLVHVKTGQMLAARGGLPPATDPFSSTAAERPWTNLAWLFDLLSAGVFAAGQWTGLSVLKIVLAAITFGLLVQISRPKIPTWWGSICAALAAIVCLPRLTAQPELITLLGTSLTLLLLFGRERGAPARQLWLLVPVFLVWSNLDERMFLGLFFVLLYALGDLLGSRTRRLDSAPPAHRRQLWIVLGASAVAAMVNPFTWKWLLAPADLFGRTYPGFRAYASSRPGSGIQYFPMASEQFWTNLEPTGILALVLYCLAGATLVLNWRRLELSHLFLFLGATALAILSVHELAAASLVFAALATLNGQAWYAATFSGTYSVETRELVFSRGGRVLTVVALFAVALLATTGQLRAPGGAGLGFGLDPDLANLVTSYRQQFKEPPPGHAFNFVLSQGDLLIWNGLKSFVDSRASLFSGTGDYDLIQLHRRVREALSPHEAPPAGSKPGQLPKHDKQEWQVPLDKYGVTYALPRLSGATPDYIGFIDLLRSPDWRLVNLGSATAIMCRNLPNNAELQAYIAAHKPDFIKQAFREPVEPPVREGWVELPTFYQKYLWGIERHISPESQQARHLLFLAGLSNSPDLIYLAIRNAQQALAHNVNDPQAYLRLGDAYTQLGNIEKSGLNRPLGDPVARLRYFQAVMALNQAIVANQDSFAAHYQLAQFYLSSARFDLAAREFEACDRLLQRIEYPSENELRQQQEVTELLSKLQTAIEKIQKEATDRVTKGESPLQIAALYYQNGCLLNSLQELDAHPEVLIGQPQVQLLRTMALLEAGRVEEAYDSAAQLEGAAPQSGFQEWREPRALAYLGHGEYDQAVQVWTQEAEALETNALRNVLGSLAVRNTPAPNSPWPISLLMSATDYFYQAPQQASRLYTLAGLIQLEAGRVKKAQATLEKALEMNPETPDRRLIVSYLTLMTGKSYEVLPPSEVVPILFADEPGAAP
jgi:tetratricopeptide (TPR) repeat protein